MIKIENLNFKYKREENILKNINLDIKEGECIAIVGKNGSGKSTFAKLIAGIMKVMFLLMILILKTNTNT